MAKIIRRSCIITTVTFERRFARKGERHFSGYTFPCTESGQMELTAVQQQSLVVAQDATRFDDLGIIRVETDSRLPRVIECHCGEHLELWDSWSNECECGQFYNSSGQALSHPSNWGEETGERFSDSGQFIS